MPSEFDLIQHYFTCAATGAILSMGDAAALIRTKDGMELAANLSDMAATSAQLRWPTIHMP